MSEDLFNNIRSALNSADMQAALYSPPQNYIENQKKYRGASNDLSVVEGQLAIERAKVEELSEVIDSQKQTHYALIKKLKEFEEKLDVEYHNAQAWKDDCKKFESQNAALREVLEAVDMQKDCLSFNCANKVIQALALTPSDAAEMVRKKDGSKSYSHEYEPNDKYPWFCKKCGYPPHDKIMHKAIEAARAAGVEVEG